LNFYLFILLSEVVKYEEIFARGSNIGMPIISIVFSIDPTKKQSSKILPAQKTGCAKGLDR